MGLGQSRILRMFQVETMDCVPVRQSLCKTMGMTYGAQLEVCHIGAGMTKIWNRGERVGV